MRNFNRNKQQGFGAAALIAVIALLSLLGVITASSLGYKVNTEKSEIDIVASHIIYQARTIENGIFTLLNSDPRITEVEGILLNSDAMIYPGAPSSVGLFNASEGAVDLITPPTKALTNTNQQWLINTDSGMHASGSTYINLPQIKQEYCLAINDILNIPAGQRTVAATASTTLCDESSQTLYSLIKHN